MKPTHKRLTALTFVMVLLLSMVPAGAVGQASAVPTEPTGSPSGDTFTVQQDSGACYIVQAYSGLPAHVSTMGVNEEGGRYQDPDWNGPITVESVMDYRFTYDPNGGDENPAPWGQYKEDAPYLNDYYIKEPWTYSTYGLYNWSANGESHMFFYRGANGISLVMRHDRLYDANRNIVSHDPYDPVHDRLDDGPGFTKESPGGGAASFQFSNLPSGEWAYLDDALPSRYRSDSFSGGDTSYYHNHDEDGGTSYKNFHGGNFTIDWRWWEGTNDGGAYRGFENLDGAVTITPQFNGQARLWQTGPQSDTHQNINSWKIRDARDNQWYSLDRDSPLTITRGANCDGETPPSTTPDQPTVQSFTMNTANDGQDLQVQIKAGGDAPTDIGVAVTGDDGFSRTLTLDSGFDGGSGTYTASISDPGAGNYTATLNTLANDGGDGANGETATAAIESQTTTTEEPTTEQPTTEEPTTTTTTERPTTTTEQQTEEQQSDSPSPSPSPSSGGSASYGSGAANPPSVVADVEQAGENQLSIDVRNARDDEDLEMHFPTDTQTMKGFRFTDLTVDLRDDDPHFTMDVSMSAEAPSGASDLSDVDATMSYVKIDHKYLDADQVKKATFTFSVSKHRLDEAGLAAEDVSLYRYGGGDWTKMNTSVTEEKKNRYVLNADSPGFSTFAVAGTKTVSITDMSLSKSTITAGEDAKLHANIRNTGDTDRTYDAELVLNGKVVDTKEVSVAAGKTAEVSFSRTFDEPGNYRLSVGDVIADLVVETKQTSTTTTTSKETTDAGISTSIEGGETNNSSGQPGFGPLAALIAFAGAMLLIERRR